jgi:hypothetical protein
MIVCWALANSSIASLSTLAWREYGSEVHPRPLWTVVVEKVVILFPAINMLSCSPLIAVVLAENSAAFIGADVNSKVVRLVIWVFPLIANIFVYDLGVIVAFCGLFSFSYNYALGAMIYIKSDQLAPIKSKYGGIWSNSAIARVIIAISVALTGMAMYGEISKLSEE